MNIYIIFLNTHMQTYIHTAGHGRELLLLNHILLYYRNTFFKISLIKKKQF
uniref:Uncharacterized protein n=1 Tax=Octopus bimaculoides TaxID=37653 RepID=A0A0L8GBW7_OCTBM